MEALSILKFWRSQTAVADVESEAAVATTTTTTTTDEDETTDEEDSFFDLVFEPSNKNYHFVESPKTTKTNNLSTHAGDNIKPSSSPVTTLRHPSVAAAKPRSFTLSFKKSSKNNDDAEVSERRRRFDRDNSLRSKMMSENRGTTTADQTTSVSRYFRLIKPLVSKKGRVTEILTPFASPANASTRKLAQSRRVGSFKISINVGRNSWKGSLGFPAAPATVSGAEDVPRRRDGSLLEQQNDGIQGAILHCKRSYSSTSSSSSQESSQLIRSASDPSHEKFVAQGRYSCEEQKRCSI